MDLRTIISAILIAIAFVGWPIVGKYAQANGATTVATVSFAACAMTILLARSQFDSQLPLKGFILLSVVGIANGYAVYKYGFISGKPDIPTGAFIVLVSLCMVVSAPLLDWAFNGNAPTFDRLFGYGLAAGAIYWIGR